MKLTAIKMRLFRAALALLVAQTFAALPATRADAENIAPAGCGELFLLLEADTQNFSAQILEKLKYRLSENLAGESIPAAFSSTGDGEFSFEVNGAADAAVNRILSENFPGLQYRTQDLPGGGVLYRTALTENFKKCCEQAGLEITRRSIRRRAELLGAQWSEAMGESGLIAIKLKGLSDAEEAAQLILRPARLEFYLEAHPPAQNASDALAPAFDQPISLPLLATPTDGAGFMLLEPRPVLDGEYVEDARAVLDDQGKPFIIVTFNRDGSGRLENVTGENIGRRMAVAVDGIVYSAPIIMGKITEGSAAITGLFSEAEAGTLATAIRAGPLPAPVSVIEMRHSVCE